MASVKIYGAGRGRASVTSKDAEAVLAGRPPGTYLLRHSISTIGGYAIAVAIPSPKKDGQRFEELSALIDYYKTSSDGLSIILTDNVVDLIEADSPPPRPPKSVRRRTGSDSGAVVIPTSKLTMGKELGEGQFGTVFEATWTRPDGIRQKVAVKTVKGGTASEEQIQEQQREAAIMVQFKHENVVQMLGISRLSGVSLVVELVPGGQLNTFLLTEKFDLTVVDLFNMVKQIASGMKYMSSKKFVHRDLAARNVLVMSKNLVKISDFGLSRPMREKDYYRAAKKGRWPIKWYAPECLYDSLFSTASDVWSYGVTSWEVLSWGKKPWWGLNARQVVVALHEGIRLPKPEDCCPELFTILMECWAEEAKNRPDFQQILMKLESVFPAVKAFAQDDDDYNIMHDINPALFERVVNEQKFYAIEPTDQEAQLEVEEERQALMQRRSRPVIPKKKSLLIPNNQLFVMNHIYPSGTSPVSTPYQGVRKVPGTKDLPVTVVSLDVVMCNPKALVQEVEMLSNLDSPYLLKFLGMVPSEEGPLGYALLVSEYLASGPLDRYLQRMPQPPLTLLKYSSQVACGLEYLKSQNVVHREVASRNVHVYSPSMVKIVNFNMARVLDTDATYYRSKVNGRWLLKWFAPEVLLEMKYSFMSDVWSYGITLWEILSLGAAPYGNLTGDQVLRMLHSGKRMEVPPLFAGAKYHAISVILDGCWKLQPDQRISIERICELLNNGNLVTQRTSQRASSAAMNHGGDVPPVPRRRSTGHSSH